MSGAADTASDCDSDAGDDRPARAQCYLNIQEGSFEFRAVEDDMTQGRAELDIEIWGETDHREAKLYLHGSGDLPRGGEYRAGFVLPYVQAHRLRDLLDDALAEFGVSE